MTEITCFLRALSFIIKTLSKFDDFVPLFECKWENQEINHNGYKVFLLIINESKFKKDFLFINI